MDFRPRLLKHLLSDIHSFSRWVVGRELRSYQLEPARAILSSVLGGKGLTFAVMMSRQSGKNETSAQVEAYLLNLFQRKGGFIVKAAPTYVPQIVNSRLRLEEALDNPWNRGKWQREGHMVRLGKARAAFFSAQPEASVMGATASLLLECDEAQDVEGEKWDKEFRPMAASANATTVLWGTAWTSRTLLARTIRTLAQEEGRDGIRRVFIVPWQKAAAENPAYGTYVEGEIGRLGRDHPLTRTQYFLEELEERGGMFPPARRAQMQGEHPGRHRAEAGKCYCLLIDVAGEEEGTGGETLATRAKLRDSTALTVVEVDAQGLDHPLQKRPTYRVVERRLWTGTKHTQLFSQLLDLAEEVWQARHLVIDATGVGAGLASFLRDALGEGRVMPFHFTAQSKSDLGWGFLAICDTGRFKDMREDGSPEYRQFWKEVEAADYQVLPGPERRMRWGVEDPLVHDDLLVSAALTAALDRLEWAPQVEPAVIQGPKDEAEGRD